MGLSEMVLDRQNQSETSGTIAIKVRIHGRVQGVGYRAWTTANARELGLDGWVRNRHDGTVEALFKGNAEVVEAMLTRCKKGPGPSRVEQIVREEAEGIVDKGFVHKPTV